MEKVEEIAGNISKISPNQGKSVWYVPCSWEWGLAFLPFVKWRDAAEKRRREVEKRRRGKVMMMKRSSTLIDWLMARKLPHTIKGIMHCFFRRRRVKDYIYWFFGGIFFFLSFIMMEWLVGSGRGKPIIMGERETHRQVAMLLRSEHHRRHPSQKLDMDNRQWTISNAPTDDDESF